MRRALLWLSFGGLLLLSALQFLRPTLTNPPLTAELQVPEDVKAVLRKSCYNCHSNETKLLWFDQIVPAFWLVSHDVRLARQRVNFSEIGAQSQAKQRATLFEAVNQIQLGAMPLPSYRAVHPESSVTESQLRVLRGYLSSPAATSATSPADARAEDAQYSKWIQSSGPAVGVPDSPNGVAFVPEYKRWRAISSTDRFDNNTMRVILGNDVAIQAISENRINPWPDGTIFAKVTWHTHPDGIGFVQTGAFQQVELMIRDHREYESTKGWGWGRWLGTELKPYGKEAAFASECVSCHTPVQKNDYVYTLPLERRP